jgi:DNA-binding MarR family transcriptional regulator
MTFVGGSGRTSKRELATEVWRLLADFTFTRFQRGEHIAVLRSLGLTPGHLRALGVCDPDEPRPMGAMAEALSCDASMATWLVDRLEDHGLVERRSLPHDRRVKTVVLTPKGIQIRARLAEALYEPPKELLKLDAAALESLKRELSKLPAAEHPMWSRPVAAAADAPRAAG